MLVLEMISLDVLLDDALVSEDSELLLQARLLFLSDVKLNKRGMNVPHHFELVKRECYVDAWAIHKFD